MFIFDIADFSYQSNKKQKISHYITTNINNQETQQFYHGWFSKKFITEFYFVPNINNVIFLEPIIHKYLTKSNSEVLVTHVTSNITSMPNFSDVIYIGEVKQYIESLYY